MHLWYVLAAVPDQGSQPPPCSVPLWFPISRLIAAAAAAAADGAEGVGQAGWHGMGAPHKGEGLRVLWYLATGCWRTFKL